MANELWSLSCLALFFCAVQFCLGRRGQHSVEEARMLPFADDPEVAARMEKATRLSRSGCGCPGACTGECKYHQSIDI